MEVEVWGCGGCGGSSGIFVVGRIYCCLREKMGKGLHPFHTYKTLVPF